MPFSSAAYWEARYRSGSDSGAGPSGALARYKADLVNAFIKANNVASMIDFGCGDASQLALLEPPADYVGVDIAPAAVSLCRSIFPDRRFISPDQLPSIPPAELTVALDVLFHLVEDAEFTTAMRSLFASATRYVVIYSSDLDATWPADHVRHRRFTTYVARSQPAWRLLAHLPNPRPYDPARPNDTSFADFFVYGRPGQGCLIPVPST